MPLDSARPKRDDGFERRTAGPRAGDLGDEDGIVVRQRQTFTRPILHPLQRADMFGVLPECAETQRRLAAAVLGMSAASTLIRAPQFGNATTRWARCDSGNSSPSGFTVTK